MKHWRSITTVAWILLLYPPEAHSQQLDERLRGLEPLLDKTWIGMMEAPDGTQASKIVLTYEAILDGKAVRFSRVNPDRNVSAEGYFYWDNLEQKVAYFLIGTGGNYAQGFVGFEGNTVTIEGKAVLAQSPRPGGPQTLVFRHTFEWTEDGRLIDRYYLNLAGVWQAGHVIEFRIEG